MSTDLYLRCVSHEPYLESHEVGHSTISLEGIREDFRNRFKWAEAWKEHKWDFQFGTDYKRARIDFIVQHLNCDIQLWDEYGRQHALMEGDPPDIRWRKVWASLKPHVQHGWELERNVHANCWVLLVEVRIGEKMFLHKSHIEDDLVVMDKDWHIIRMHLDSVVGKIDELLEENRV